MNKDKSLLKLVALHRHWIVADAVRVVLRHKVVTPKEEEEEIKKFGLEYAMVAEHASMVCRMQVWYALLFVVIEGYRELGFKHEGLDQVLAQEEYVDLLRRFRNATFHYQPDPLNDKLIDFLAKEDSEHWIANLNKQMNAMFMEVLPIKEQIAKWEKEGVPKIKPSGTKIDRLMFPVK
jgi:hypothetical protein